MTSFLDSIEFFLICGVVGGLIPLCTEVYRTGEQNAKLNRNSAFLVTHLAIFPLLGLVLVAANLSTDPTLTPYAAFLIGTSVPSVLKAASRKPAQEEVTELGGVPAGTDP